MSNVSYIHLLHVFVHETFDLVQIKLSILIFHIFLFMLGLFTGLSDWRNTIYNLSFFSTTSMQYFNNSN